MRKQRVLSSAHCGGPLARLASPALLALVRAISAAPHVRLSWSFSWQVMLGQRLLGDVEAVQRIDDRGELKELVLSLAAATTGASSTESVRVGVCKLAMLPGISFESLESDVRSDEVVSLSESTVNDLAKADSVGPSCGPARAA